MPQLPESVTIVTKKSTVERFEIDGTEFPWFLSRDEGVVVDMGEKLSRVTVTILVENDHIIRSEP